MLRALLLGLLEPPNIRAVERLGDTTSRLALQEAAKGLPFGAVWDHFCQTQDVPVEGGWLPEVQRYERDILSRRS
jgi:L-rhamnose isomerase